MQHPHRSRSPAWTRCTRLTHGRSWLRACREGLTGLWAAPGPGAQGLRLSALHGSDLYRSTLAATAAAATAAAVSRDGLRWEKLPVGSFAGAGHLTVGPSGLLYAGQAAEGGDGVWRSGDGGDTWELLSAGLKPSPRRSGSGGGRCRPCVLPSA